MKNTYNVVQYCVSLFVYYTIIVVLLQHNYVKCMVKIKVIGCRLAIISMYCTSLDTESGTHDNSGIRGKVLCKYQRQIKDMHVPV